MARTAKKPKRQASDTVGIAKLQAENKALKAELNTIRSKKIESKKAKRQLWRPITAGILAVIAVVCFTLYNVSFWVRNTVTDTDQFVSTMQPLIQDADIQAALQSEITNEVFARVNLEQELKKALPENLQFIAAPFAGQVKSFTYGKIGEVLNSQAAFTVWTQTLGAGHQRIIAYIEDPSNTGVITVDSVYQLAGGELKDSDVGFLFGKTLPSSVGEIKLAEIEGISEARQALNTLKETTLALGVASFVAAALAITISPRRRNMIIGLAVFTLLLMLSTLGALWVAEQQAIAATAHQYKAAATATFEIITAPLVAQTKGIAALLAAGLLIAIISSSWKAIVWVKKHIRRGLDAVSRRAVGTWKGATWLHWIDENRPAINWTLVAVLFAAFALRLPPTVSGVTTAVVLSAIASALLEIFCSLARSVKK